MSWPADYFADTQPWLNPWPIKYLLPSMKNVRVYWPTYSWQVEINADNEKRGQLPVPPNGVEIPWWLLPKAQWPILTPWEMKVFGAWPPSKITMAEDLQKPSIWPGPYTTPPWGYIKLRMPGQKITKEYEISFMKMKIQINHFINYISPSLKMVARQTPMGVKYDYINGSNMNMNINNGGKLSDNISMKKSWR